MNKIIGPLLTKIGEYARRTAGVSGEEYVQKIDRQLIAAGTEGEGRAIRMLGAQVVSLVLFPAVWLFILSSLSWFKFMFEGPKQVVFYLGFIIFGFFFPMMKTRDRIKKRQDSIAIALPDMVDLITISVEAGLDFMTALQRVVSKQRKGPLREEMERFFRQMELGRTRRESLKELGNRVQLSDLSNMCSALIQADRLGSSIAPVLRTQSDVLRTRRMQRAEKNAMEAPIKMMAPLLMCIFPSVFIVMFAPLFIQMFQNLTR